MNSYCDYASGHPLHRPYHDLEYGFPLRTDNDLFERLVLEMNQAGLSWQTILQKRKSFKAAYDQFEIKKVAAYGQRDVQRLLKDAGIIRNRLKIEAAVENAQRILALQKEHGSFASWLNTHHPRSKGEWVKLFKKTFRFTGGEITSEFLMSTGYLPGAHKPECPVYARILKVKPAWAQAIKRATVPNGAWTHTRYHPPREHDSASPTKSREIG